MKTIDAVFVTPPSRLAVYQGLSNNLAAIEPPVWSSLIANYLIKKNSYQEMIIVILEMEKHYQDYIILNMVVNNG